MRRGLTISLVLLVILAGVFVSIPAPAEAAPVAPSLSATINPDTLVPGQAGYVFVGGGYPLRVSVKLDNTPLDVFWTGSGYLALYSFDLDESPGRHPLVIQAVDLISGARLEQEAALTVDDFTYKDEQVPIPYRLQFLLDPQLNQGELDHLREVYAQRSRPARFDWPFSVPVPGGIVTSRYGGNRVYNGGVLAARHTGIDFRRAIGEPVLAAADGRVAFADHLDIRGNVIILDHGHGVFTQYAHLSQIQVEVGQPIQRGLVIGLAGATGRSNGPHLHFEVIVNGFPVDPMRWLALAPGFVPPREATPAPNIPAGS